MLEVNGKANCVGLMFSNKQLNEKYDFALACDSKPLFEMEDIISQFHERK